jgi:hypothetical protein
LWVAAFAPLPVDSKAFSETVTISKPIAGGTYSFYVLDWMNGLGSTDWTASGIKAYLYKENKLIKTYTPPGDSASGAYWVISDIKGTTMTDLNYLTNTH